MSAHKAIHQAAVDARMTLSVVTAQMRDPRRRPQTRAEWHDVERRLERALWTIRDARDVADREAREAVR